MNNEEKGVVLNLAYYYIMGASLLLNKFDRDFKASELDVKGKAKFYLGQAETGVKAALRSLDSFDEEFLKKPELWDDYMRVSNELIGMNIEYLWHCYPSGKDSAEVLRLMRSKGTASESLDALSGFYLKRGVE